MQRKIAFVFPGQGSQTVGMGKDLMERYPIARKTFEEADEALGFSISKMCFEGPEADLRLTFNTQPAILTVSVAAYRILAEHGLQPVVAAGHSLGEYSALVASGAMTFADAVRLVRKRGQFMQEAVPVGEGGMAAIMGLDSDTIVAVCQKVEADSGFAVQAVNFNCPGQIAIAGAAKGVEAAIAALKEAGAKRAVSLPVSAPFHSTLMKPAAERLAAALAEINIGQAAFPVVSNVNAEPVTDGNTIRQLLVAQAASPVRWIESVEQMGRLGCDLFVEIGPGKVLTGFTKKILKEAETLNVEDLPSLEKTLDYFREVR